MSKQDGYASRTAADLERKYNFGQTFAEVYGLISDAQTAANEAQTAVEGLDSEEIFNRLTNYGEHQGIYRGDDGGVYINASFIKSGTITGDSVKVEAATITGQLVATQIDTKDLKVLAANITGTLTAGQIDTTFLTVSAANITGTFTAKQIDATDLKVNAANITGTLVANRIAESTDRSWIQIGERSGRYGYLEQYHYNYDSGGSPATEIGIYITSSGLPWWSLSAMGTTILEQSGNTGYTLPKGTWDFSYCTTVGLNVTAVFAS